MQPFVPFFDYMYSGKARWVAVKRQWGVSIEYTFFRNGKSARLKDLEKFTQGTESILNLLAIGLPGGWGSGRFCARIHPRPAHRVKTPE